MAKCIAVLKVCKAADERQDYAFNLTREFVRLWEPDAPFAMNQVVRPNSTPGTGFEYKSAGGVSSGLVEPPWPVTGIVVDGSITWTAQPMSNDGLRHRIAGVEWEGPSDIELSDQVEIDDPAQQEVRIWVEPGGEVGETYEIEGEVTTDQNAVFVVRIKLTIV